MKRLVFLGFLFIIVAEYLPLSLYVPLPGAGRLTLLVSLVLVGAIVFQFGVLEFSKYAPVKAMYFFIFLTATALYHGLIQSYAIEPLQQQIGYTFLAIICYYALDDFRRFNRFAWFFVALHCLLVVVNIDRFARPERAGAFDAGYFLGDGNDFAWGLVVALPYAVYLMRHHRRFVLRLPAIGAVLLLLVGIVGTQSRGATLAIAASILYFWWMGSKNRFAGFMVILVLVVGVVAVAPGQYLNRVESITQYEEDSSAMNRLRAWADAVEMAVDNPLLGVGAGSYNSAYGRIYRDPGDPRRWISTHSIYFKVLGEYGFFGLGVFLFILFSLWRNNRSLRRSIEAHPDATQVPYYLPELLNMSLVGFAAAGAFLSGVNYPHLYVLVGASLALTRLVRVQMRRHAEQEQETAEEVSVAPAASRWSRTAGGSAGRGRGS